MAIPSKVYDRRVDGSNIQLVYVVNGEDAVAVAIPVRIIGSVVPTTRAIVTVTGTVAVDGTALIAAPAVGNRIVVVSFRLQKESNDATACVVILNDGTTDRERVYTYNLGDGVDHKYNQGDEWRLLPAAPLTINLSAAHTTGYTIRYFIEAA